MRAYIASGWFNENQAKDLELIKKSLKACDIEFFSPKDECICPPTADAETQQKVFDGNVQAIETCHLVVVNTRDKDLGTIFEAGYAYAKGIPIIYYCEGLKGNFNLMLSRSGRAVATDVFTLLKHLEGFKNNTGYYEEYKGVIE